MRDEFWLGFIVLAVWGVASIAGSIIFLPSWTTGRGTMHHVFSYYGDAGNTTYSIMRIDRSDGGPSFNVTISCNYYKDGQTVQLSLPSREGPWIFYPILRGPSEDSIYKQGLLIDVPKGC